ncbi:MAG TPA: Ku protein [Solirubrobacteraceae bacterium]|jgi:DNA end-binding protein Ku|nr:Ku protein [Solirubrobacteraceae bacterium]
MARAIWSGAISFGLVNVPVKLYAATSPKSVRFHQLSAKTGARIKQKRVDATTGDEVPYEDIVKGYEITPDRYVVVTPEELETLDAKATKTIDVEDFVDLVDIDPIYFDHAYYVAPATGGAKAYRLLLDAMRESGKVALARIVLRSKQQLCALRPAGDVLTLSTMLFGDEVLAPDRLDELDSITEAEASERELTMARQLIDSLSSDFEPDKYRDEYRDRVLALIERKAGGEEITVQPAAEEPEPAPDLMAALEASLAAVKDDGDAPPAKPRKRAAAKDDADGAKPTAKAKAKAKRPTAAAK